MWKDRPVHVHKGGYGVPLCGGEHCIYRQAHPLDEDKHTLRSEALSIVGFFIVMAFLVYAIFFM